MLEYLAKRLGMAAVTLLAILLVSYALVRLAPGDPTRSSFFGGAGSEGLSADRGELAQNRALREKLHLDRPVLVGFALWLRGVLRHGDLGDSAAVDKGRPVGRVILERLPVTVTLNAWAVLLTYLLAIPLGIHSALARGSRLDGGITFFLFFLYSLPSFWVALLLQATLCEGGWLGWLPLKGMAGDVTWGRTTLGGMLAASRHYLLPIFCLSYGGFAGLSRYARAGMIEVIRQDYIRTARAKGLSEHAVILKHALRNAMITLVTLFAGLLPGLVAGSIIIEHVFSIPGMGSLSMLALSSRDIPLLMALFGFGGALTLGGIILSDLLYVLIDPRISFAGRS